MNGQAYLTRHLRISPCGLQAENMNPIGEFIYSEFPFIDTPNLKSVEKLTLIPVTLGQAHLEQIDIIHEKRNRFKIHFLLFVFLYQFHVLDSHGCGKRNHYSNLQVSKFIQRILFYLISN